MKEELARLWPDEAHCRRAELAALARAGGHRQDGAFIYACDQAYVARKVLLLLRAVLGVRPEVLARRRPRLQKNLVYSVRVADGDAVARELALEAPAAPDRFIEDDHCLRAYLRGCFLATGWVGAPERSHHLELTVATTEEADSLGQMLFAHGLPAKVTARKDAFVLYLKDAEHIARFLALVGAHQGLLHFEDVRALKDMKNRINRQVNADTANLTKTIEASARQVECIERLAAGGRLERLPQALQELARLRLLHPEATLAELGELMQPPLGKSGVNHRMRQLMQWAERET